MKNIINYDISIFDSIKHIDEYGNEYWLARELQKVLEYKQWRRFEEAIKKAKESCEVSNYNILDNFANVGKIVKTGVATKSIIDHKLSRYACYLIVMNGDPRKEVVALAQTYFAIQTRRQELLEESLENDKRISLRRRVKTGNLGLNKTAINSGVKDLGRFHNAGYKGLYNGETADDIAKRKNLRYREDILDNMGSTELAANLFRITQTDDRLKKDNADNKYTASSIHYEMGKKVRKAIKDMRGTMPEELPTPNKSLKEIEKDNKNSIK